jgi:pyruvate kinase
MIAAFITFFADERHIHQQRSPWTVRPRPAKEDRHGRRAKIVCTLGPATSSPDQIAALVAAGLDVARLKMSHGSQASHHAAYSNIRAAGDASGRSVGVLVDLQGPKIRLGRRCWTSGDVQGDLVVIVAGSPPGTPGRTNALRVHRIGDAVEI